MVHFASNAAATVAAKEGPAPVAQRGGAGGGGACVMDGVGVGIGVGVGVGVGAALGLDPVAPGVVPGLGTVLVSLGVTEAVGAGISPGSSGAQFANAAPTTQEQATRVSCFRYAMAGCFMG
jgi:hypothetical protein